MTSDSYADLRAETVQPSGERNNNTDGDGRSAGSASAGAVSRPFPRLHDAALYGLAGAIVRTILPHTEADVPNLLLHFLTQFGNAAGRHLYAKGDGSKHYMNLYTIIVGETNTAKGTGLRRTQNAMECVDPVWRTASEARGLSSGEGIIAALADADPNDPDATERDRRMMCLVPEFGAMLKIMGREGNSLSGVLREGWDDDRLTILTRSSTSCTRAHISFIGHVTPGEMAKRLSESDVFNGFSNRYLFCHVTRSKKLPEGGGEPVLGDLVRRLRSALLFAGKDQEVVRDEEAKALWATHYARLTRTRLGPLGSVVARAVPQVLRLSLIYAALDESPLIRKVHLQAALAVWNYCEASARLIFSEKTGDRVVDRILAALRDAGPDGLDVEDTYRLFSGNESSERRRAALDLLVDAGLATRTVEQTDGRDRTVYRATDGTEQEAHEREGDVVNAVNAVNVALPPTSPTSPTSGVHSNEYRATEGTGQGTDGRQGDVVDVVNAVNVAKPTTSPTSTTSGETSCEGTGGEQPPLWPEDVGEVWA